MDFLVNWLAATPVFAVPLILASIGLIINERAGVLNLGAEGMMLCGALAGIAFYIEITNNVAVALFGSMLAGIILSFFFGCLIVLLRANQVVSGITLVFFGSGLTGFIGPNWADKTVKGIEKYNGGAQLYAKGTPVHVKATRLYNHYLKEKKCSQLFPVTI